MGAFMINENQTEDAKVSTKFHKMMFNGLKAKIVITEDFKNEFGDKHNEIIGKDYVTELRKACGYPKQTFSCFSSKVDSAEAEPRTIVEVTNTKPLPGHNRWVFDWTVPEKPAPEPERSQVDLNPAPERKSGRRLIERAM